MLMGYSTIGEDMTGMSSSIAKTVKDILRSVRRSPQNAIVNALLRLTFLKICNTIMLVGPNPIKPNIELTKAKTPISFLSQRENIMVVVAAQETIAAK